MNPADMGLHYRQRPMQIDAVINEPSLNDILPKPIPSSVTNKRLDIISTKIDQSTALTQSDHNSAALEQNQNNKQKRVLSSADNVPCDESPVVEYLLPITKGLAFDRRILRDVRLFPDSLPGSDDVTCFVLSAEDKTRFCLLFWFCSKAAEL
jgi:hypothetical protein